MFESFLVRKFKILSIFLICNGHDVNLLYLLDFVLFTNPDKASRLLPFLVQLPLPLLSDMEILLFGFIHFPKSLKNWDSRLDLLILGKHLLFLGCKDHIICGISLENPPIMRYLKIWRFSKVFSWNDAFRTPLLSEVFNFRFSLASLLLFFLLLFDDDGPPGGEPFKEDAPVRGFERFSLNATLLLSSDVLMTRFSLGTNWSILQRGKV